MNKLTIKQRAEAIDISHLVRQFELFLEGCYYDQLDQEHYCFVELAGSWKEMGVFGKTHLSKPEGQQLYKIELHPGPPGCWARADIFFKPWGMQHQSTPVMHGNVIYTSFVMLPVEWKGYLSEEERLKYCGRKDDDE